MTSKNFINTVFWNYMARDAIDKRDFKKLSKALKKGANPNAKYCSWKESKNDKSSLLHIAVDLGWLEAVEEICKHGANVEVRGGPMRQSPLFTATDRKNLEMIEILASYGAKMDSKGYCIDYKERDRLLNNLGDDYPGLHKLLSAHEVDVQYLFDYFNRDDMAKAYLTGYAKYSKKSNNNQQEMEKEKIVKYHPKM